MTKFFLLSIGVTALNCSSIYPNPIFNNQSFKEDRGRESGKAQRGINFQCCDVV